MSATSNGRVLRIALAASVAVHLVIAAVVIHSRPVTAAPEQKPDKTYIIHLPPPRPTPPPPKPALPHPQHKSAAFHPAIHVAQLPPSTHHDGPPIAPPIAPTGDPNVFATPGPDDTAPTSGPIATPSPTPKPACSAPDVPAKTLVTQTAERPEDAGGYSGRAKVQVDLDASGNVLGASIYESTGSLELDRAALAAARASRYAPEERDCRNVSGSYLFIVDFEQ